MKVQTVHVVDDDTSFRTALSRMLRANGYVVRSFESARDFLAQLEPETPGCAVVDLQMPDMTGLDLQTSLMGTSSAMPLVFLTGHGSISDSVSAIRKGAEDFLEKCSPGEKLLEAIQRALARDELTRETHRHQRELRARFDVLTSREHEVLAHVVRGKMNKEIAADLGIHERTVKLHRTAITTKLGVPSVAELTRLVHEAGILP
ncbi:MAG: response regulator transcription factor [Verrucomicrobium sp.]|nr:response regulator [Verrucomicrobium sp.]